MNAATSRAVVPASQSSSRSSGSDSTAEKSDGQRASGDARPLTVTTDDIDGPTTPTDADILQQLFDAAKARFCASQAAAYDRLTNSIRKEPPNE